MNKKLLTVLLLALAMTLAAFGLSSCNPSHSEVETPGDEQVDPIEPDEPADPNPYDLKFTLNGGTYSVSKGGFTGGKLVIPSEYEGKPVTSIEARAFQDCSGLTEITIPDSVTSIGMSAFYRCSGLTGELTIPDSVTSIGEYAFYQCSGLTGVTIGSGVASIQQKAFAHCDGLASIVVAEANPVFHSKNNCIIQTASKSLVLGCRNSVIPDDGSVTSIKRYAFYECSGLTSITIPNGVTAIEIDAFFGTGFYNDPANWDEGNVLYIGEYLLATKETISGSYSIRANTKLIADQAFNSRKSLTGITIPDSVMYIGSNAFYGSNQIQSATMPTLAISFIPKNSLKEVVLTSGESISSQAFENCSGLTSITIPESVTSIGEKAFSNCTGLESVSIRGNVTSIRAQTFWSCNKLKSIEIPSSVTTIENFAFYHCSELKTIYYKGTIDEWTDITIANDGDALTGKSNADLLSATRYYYSENTPTTQDMARTSHWWHYDPETDEPTPWGK